MIRIILPGTDRRATLRAFWLTLSLVVGCAIGMSLSWAHVQHARTVAAASALAFASLVFVRETAAWRAYRGWNRFLARPPARRTQRLILRLCFWVIRTAALAGRPNIGVTQTTQGGAWRPRSSLPPTGYESLFFATGGPSLGAGDWREEYRRWAAQSGHLWAITLLPFLTLLRWVNPEEEKVAAGNIYTLF